MLNRDFTISTKNYILQIPKKSDIPHVFSASRVKGFTDGMLWEPPENIEELNAPFERGLKKWDTGEAYGFSIRKKDNLAFLGRIGISPSKDSDTWNIGFWTHPNAQKQGIMTEVVPAILQIGFKELGAKKIEACHALWNTASEKVLKRNGFLFKRYLEKGFEKNGKWVEENLLEIRREDWELFN